MPLLLLPLLLLALLDTHLEDSFSKGVLEAYEVFCISLSFLGLCFRFLTQGFAAPKSSGRAKRIKAQTLNTEGMYSCVRHPLYFGNFLVFSGLCLFTRNLWFALSSSALFLLFLERIIAAEEAFLEERFGKEFIDWADHTPTFLPDPKRWKRPSRPFSLRRAIKREYHTVFLVSCLFLALESLRTFLRSGSLLPRPFFLYFFLSSAFLYSFLRALRKWTNMLKG